MPVHINILPRISIAFELVKADIHPLNVDNRHSSDSS